MGCGKAIQGGLDRLTVPEEVMSREMLLVRWRGGCVVTIGHNLSMVQVLRLRDPVVNGHVGDGCQISGSRRVGVDRDEWRIIR